MMALVPSTPALRCYVCAPFAEGASLRRSLPGRLAAIGVNLTARWLDLATGAEDFSRYSVDELRGFALQNDEDLHGANVALLVDFFGAGRETYAEARLALEWRTPVIWVGRPTLSTWRPGVLRASDLDEAMGVLSNMAEMFPRGGTELLWNMAGGAS